MRKSFSGCRLHFCCIEDIGRLLLANSRNACVEKSYEKNSLKRLPVLNVEVKKLGWNHIFDSKVKK